jgi:calcium-dependent protein kinase
MHVVSHFDDLFCGSAEIDGLLFQADVDGNGTIDYIEFITATMHMNRMEREDHLYKAFEYFDKDKSGYLLLLL